jgi:hypothetical protein
MTPPATADVQLVEVRPGEDDTVASPIVEVDVMQINTYRGGASLDFRDVHIPVTLPAGRRVACVHIAVVLNAPGGYGTFSALTANTYTVEDRGEVRLTTLTINGPEIEALFL